ncbi:MAG: hypothetical protein MJ113_03180 [Lachnospiraceae bacterium]|nr:hypothetical protein [Lachnospiraceae bacterium]
MAKANELAAAQLGNVAFNKYDSIVFVSKSIDSQYLIHKLEKENPEYENSSDIKWNFTKFLVDRKGNVIERFEPTTDLALVDEAIAKLI